MSGGFFFLSLSEYFVQVLIFFFLYGEVLSRDVMMLLDGDLKIKNQTEIWESQHGLSNILFPKQYESMESIQVVLRECKSEHVSDA